MTIAGRVTVGITCYNARETIARAVRSAQAQDWPDLEIIVVDDASSDGSAGLVKSLIAGDSRARLVCHARNAGPGAARNTIIEEASGEFIAFFDDDDESLPNRVREQTRVLTNYEKETRTTLVACYATGERRYSSGYVKPIPAIGTLGPAPLGREVAEYLLVNQRRPDRHYGSGIPACALFARSTTFAAVGGFDAGLRRVEDADFAIRLAFAGGHLIGAEQPLFIQYATGGADKRPEINRDAHVAVAKKHGAFLQSIGRYHYALRWQELRYWHFRRRYDRFLLVLIGLLVRHPIAATRHLFATGPARLRHEHRIRKGPPS